ncbi:MAG: hypothetical protein ACFFG0_00055 [Candidatus Thorarchaeota archaeon]
MSKVCDGCTIHKISKGGGFFHNPGQCQGGLLILIENCPCRTCLVKPICRTGCKDFEENSYDEEILYPEDET